MDEIHAMADDKRGAHLALSLERLEALVCCENKATAGPYLPGLIAPPQRIGLSATQNPISRIAQFLTGVDTTRKAATIIQVGQRREFDIAIEVPSDELNSVTSNVHVGRDIRQAGSACTEPSINAGFREYPQAGGEDFLCPGGATWD